LHVQPRPRAGAAALDDAAALVAAYVAGAPAARAAFGEVFFAKIELKVDVRRSATTRPMRRQRTPRA